MARKSRAAVRPTLAAAAALTIGGCAVSDAVPAIHIEDLPELTLEEELRIGSLDDPEVGFTRIGDVWISPAGEAYVSEISELEVRVYGTDGRLLRTYGREGDGPGEFRSIGWFGVVGDTLWVSDGELHRTTLFSLDGDVVATVTALLEVPIGEDFGRPLTVSVFPNALRPDGLIESIFVRAIRANLPDSFVDVPRVVFDRSGQVVDTLEMVRTQVSRTARVLQFANGRGRAFVYPDPPAFDSGTYEVELDSGSFAVHWSVEGEQASGSLVAVRRGPDGDTTLATTLRYDPRPVTASHLDSLAASRVRGRLSRSDSLMLFEAYRSTTKLPPHHEPVSPPFAVGEGSVWTRLDPDHPSANRWLIFREDGEVLGTLSLLPGAFPRWSRGQNLWIVERDAFDVPWLVRYRIVAPAS